MSLAELRAKARPVERRVRLCVDGALLADIDDLRRRIDGARLTDAASGLGLGAEAPRLEQQLRELLARSQSDEACEVFTFRAIGQLRYEELVRAHPPTEEQRERYQELAKVNPFIMPDQYDPDGFIVALLAATCIDPAYSEDEWEEIRRDVLSDGQMAELVEAAQEVNRAKTSRPFTRPATDTTPNGGPGSTTPRNGESPSPSSREGS